MKIKYKNKKLTTALAILFFVILIAAVFLIKSSAKNNASSNNIESSYTSDFFIDNQCICLERGIKKCSEGFELSGNLCINKDKTYFTNILLGCSKYDCSGGIYELDNKTKEWSKN